MFSVLIPRPAWRATLPHHIFASLLLMSCAPGIAATGTLQDVQHVVILVQENRAFDHYFGCLNGVRGYSDPNALAFTNGASVFYQPQGTNFLLPIYCTNQCITDVDHSETTCLIAWNNGQWDQWIPAKGQVSMGYFTRAELPFYYALANAYTICDAYYCSALAPTYPNRLYLFTGMIDPNGTGGGPVLTNGVPPGGYTWTTYAERLQGNGISWRVYQQIGEDWLNPLEWFAQFSAAQPGSPLWNGGRVVVTNVITAFQSDVQAGTLPRVSWIISPWAASEHPIQAPVVGAAFVKQIIGALASNPAIYSSTVFFLTYDENGGYFDHVPPPIPPAGTADEYVNGEPIGLGVRVPMIIVSPWTRGGYVCSQVFDHTSVIQFLEKWTGAREPNISAWRRQVCGDLTSAFDFAHPNTNYPALPSITTVTCTNGFVPPVPSPQIQPVQEPGTVPVRPLPYQPDAFSLLDPANGCVWIVMTNSGTASVHLAIYANAYRGDGPWQYDVPAGASVSDCFALTNAASGYDFTCYGPNGFNRRFAGQLPTNSMALEARSVLDPDGACVNVLLENPGAQIASYTITNALGGGSATSIDVPAHTAVMQSYPVLSNNCCYDLRIVSGSDTNLFRRFAGHLELGRPMLKARLVAGMAELSFPAWASTYTPESITNTISGVWRPVTQSPVQVTNRMILDVPVNSAAAFYRLRQ